TAALDVPERNIGRTEGVSLSKDNANKMEIEQEIYEVKEMLQKLTAEKQKKIKREKKTGIRKLLLERDVSEDVINSILKSIKEKEEYKNLSRISDAIFVKGIGEVIKTGIQKNGRVQAFIGPTGVGKTTTIAKIAAFKALNMKNKVGLVTIDTYRI
ncbi:MAG TPA: hypothetical protein DD426_11770, partial [Clostridiaceae bacterium]|nr:hypothetical protein [Clostridiaceae bacterium]